MTNLYTTLNKIRQHSPCDSGWTMLLKHLNKTKADDEPLSFLTILESKRLRIKTMYTVMLKDGTVGSVDCLVVKVGQLVTIDLHDENGMPIQKIGVVDEILEDNTNYEPSLSYRLNMKYGVVNDAYVIANVNMGLNSYDTLCLICAELIINIINVDDSDFDSCSIALDNFCNAANEETGYTVSVWFD